MRYFSKTTLQTDVRRDRLDIILRILEIGSTPVKKTHILYQAGINFYQLSKYLDLLLRGGMIEQIDEPYTAFRTTEKGRSLIELFSGLDGEITPVPFMAQRDEATFHDRKRHYGH